MGDAIELVPDTAYAISVALVETTSDEVIDKMNMTIKTPPEPGKLTVHLCDVQACM